MADISRDGGILSGLTSEQIAGVTHSHGPCAIVAGPGSGKTLVMSRRVAWLINEEKIPPEKILAVTFTKVAGNELRRRCANLTKGRSYSCHISTFHSLAATILRQDGSAIGLHLNYTIYDKEDQRKVIRRVLKDMDCQLKNYNLRRILSCISNYKIKQATQGNNEVIAQVTGEIDTSDIYERYQAFLNKARAVDYDDLLIKTRELLTTGKRVTEKLQKHFEHVLVDEFQDTDNLQFDIVKTIAEPQNNICVIGDPDQSIYSWRNASGNSIQEFLDYYPSAVQLPLLQSFRSVKRIIESANSVIAENPNRIKKEMRTEKSTGPRIVVAGSYDKEGEASVIVDKIIELLNKENLPASEIAILYRTHQQSSAFERQLGHLSIPFRTLGHISFYERKEIKDILAYVRFILNQQDDVALERIISTPRKGIGDKTFTKLQSSASRHGVQLSDVLFSTNNPDNPFGLNLGSGILKKVQQFAELLIDFIEASKVEQPYDLLDTIIKKTGYIENTINTEWDHDMARDRRENIDDLIRSAERYTNQNPLEALIEMVQDTILIDKSSSKGKSESGGLQINELVTLTTLHNAKGTEYQAVFIVGVNNYLLPYVPPYSRRHNPIDEERRLFYVGMTRAREFLYVSYYDNPSLFLYDLPKEHTKQLHQSVHQEDYDYDNIQFRYKPISVKHARNGFMSNKTDRDYLN